MIKAWIEPSLDHVPAEIDETELEYILEEFSAITREVVKTVKEVSGMTNAQSARAVRAAFRMGLTIGKSYLGEDEQK